MQPVKRAPLVGDTGADMGHAALLEQRMLYCALDTALAHLAPSLYLIESVNRSSPSLSLEEIVEGGLCIGCGLCQAGAGADKIRIVLTPEGRERPVAHGRLDAATLKRINAICPGTRVEGARPEDQAMPAAPAMQTATAMRAAPTMQAADDVVWGRAEHLAIGYARDPEVRFRGSTGGVLTALG